MQTARKRTRAIDKVNLSLQRRYAKERRFRRLGLGAVLLGLLFVSVLFLDIIGQGYSAFVQTHLVLDVYFDPALIDPEGSGDAAVLERADYRRIARRSLRERFPEP